MTRWYLVYLEDTLIAHLGERTSSLSRVVCFALAKTNEQYLVFAKRHLSVIVAVWQDGDDVLRVARRHLNNLINALFRNT